MTAARLHHTCPECIALLYVADKLARRARDLDAQVEQSRKVGKGCATPALAILNNYDRDLDEWQRHVSAHLKAHRDADGVDLFQPDMKGPPL